MCHHPPRSCWLHAAAPLALLTALLVCAPRAHARPALSAELTTREYAREIQKELKAADESSDPQTRKVTRLFTSWAFFSILAVVVGVLVVGFKAGIWALSRATATTDPNKLAMSDPWVRAHLAQQKGREGPPPA